MRGGVPRGDRRTSTSLLVLAAEGRWLHRHRDKVRGALLDLGCGNAPYEPWYGSLVTWACRTDIAPLPHLSAASTAEALPFADGSFDTVMATSVIEHVDDHGAVLAEMHRVLRPGGHALVTVPFMYPTHEAPYDFRRFTSYGLEKSLRSAGFEVLQLSPMGGPIAFVFHMGAMAATVAVSGVRRLPGGAVLERGLRALVTLPQEAIRPVVSLRLGRGGPPDQPRLHGGRTAIARRRPAGMSSAPARPLDPPAAAAPTARAPLWLESVVIGASAAVLAMGTTAMVLAWLGAYRPLPALAIGAGGGISAGVMYARHTGAVHAGPTRNGSIAATVAVGIAVLFGLLAAWTPGQHIYADRDPSVYNNTALWISEHHELVVPQTLAPFQAPDLDPESPGMYLAGDHLEFQFNHLTGSVLAVARDVGGTASMFRVSAFVTALGLLAVYAVAVRCIGNAVVALVAPALLACLMPYLAIARDSYSEPFAMLMLWGGALALMRVHERSSRWSAVVAGCLVGGVSIARIDGVVYLAPALIAIVAVFGTRDRGRVGWILAGLGSSLLVSLVDVAVFSTGYAVWLKSELRLAYGALVAAAILACTGRPVVRAAARAVDRVGRRRVGWAAATLTVAGMLGLWFVRPAVTTVRAGHGLYLVESLQRAEGVGIDGSRLYYEAAVSRLAWHFGPLGLLVVIAGLAIAVFVVIDTRGRTPLVAMSTLFAGGALYLWHGSINPDHIWATRRLVPALYPALAVCSALAIDRTLRMLRESTARMVVAPALAGLVLVPPLVATWPVRWQREQDGFLAVVEEACGVAGPDAAVLIVGDEARQRLPPMIRSVCGLDVVSAPAPLAPERIVALALEVERAGRRLVLVTFDPDDAAPYASVTTGPRTTARAVNDRQLVKTIERRPDRYITETLQLWVYDVPT